MTLKTNKGNYIYLFFSFFQDEKNQLLVTNIWLKLVSRKKSIFFFFKIEFPINKETFIRKQLGKNFSCCFSFGFNKKSFQFIEKRNLNFMQFNLNKMKMANCWMKLEMNGKLLRLDWINLFSEMMKKFLKCNWSAVHKFNCENLKFLPRTTNHK